ncbi:MULTISPECIES: ETX/MTX2 family pore-forming toxin [Bacillus cereus group]|uniref:ETX/MTX2 family pore-forming toxin n=1 Tax=Bacillus cereus group TaxID=86661 RepID=UPI001558786C|nr:MULTISPECIES: ETX/MTX2 family pore-forming toxin [Bacillus cereus group]MED3080037.1 ETX/MTX2 family pore-forming toxin [Bacillus wiedmannii]UOB98544.1 putative ETX-MTX2 family-like toxin [Bacillus wiedmannii]
MNKWIKLVLCVGILTASVTTFNTSNIVYAQSSSQFIYDLQDSAIECLNSIGRNQNNAVNFQENTSAGTYNFKSVSFSSPLDIKFEKYSAEKIGPENQIDEKTVFSFTDELINRSSTSQKLSTGTRSEMVSNTTTATIIKGFKIGGKTSAKISIPFIGETGIEVSPEYNHSDATSDVKATMKTLTATPQLIDVPAGKKALVAVEFTQKTIEGKVKLSAIASGHAKGTFDYIGMPFITSGANKWVKREFDMSLNQIYKRFAELSNEANDPSIITMNPDNETITLHGEAKYTSENTDSSFRVHVDIVDIDTNNNNRINKRDIINSYSYTVNL